MAWRVLYMGEDCGRWLVLFHDCTVAALRDLGPVCEAEAGKESLSPTLWRFTLCPLSHRSRSSENMGAVRGDDARPRAELLSPEMLDEESEMASALDADRLRLGSCVICAASASLLWRALVICTRWRQRSVRALITETAPSCLPC